MERGASNQPLSTCPSEESLLAAAVPGGSSRDDRLLEHIQECVPCRVAMAAAVAAAGHDSEERVRPRELPNALGVGELLLERYEVVRFVARGGMGEVYEVHDRLLEQTVALKTLASADLNDEGAVERMKREVRAARRVTHPNVCRLLEFGVHRRGREWLPCLIMELLEGETLAGRLARGATARDTLGLFEQVLDGVAAIHGSNVVHGDLKPENVFLTSCRDGEGRVVVMDFGLARPVRSSRSGLLSPAGTPGYMAPEQLRGSPATIASDIFALGMIMGEIEKKWGLGAIHRRRRRHWLRTMRACLAGEPSSRPPSVVALKRLLDGGWGRAVLRSRSWPRVAVGALLGAACLTLSAWLGYSGQRQAEPPAAALVEKQSSPAPAQEVTRSSPVAKPSVIVPVPSGAHRRAREKRLASAAANAIPRKAVETAHEGQASLLPFQLSVPPLLDSGANRANDLVEPRFDARRTDDSVQRHEDDLAELRSRAAK